MKLRLAVGAVPPPHGVCRSSVVGAHGCCARFCHHHVLLCGCMCVCAGMQVRGKYGDDWERISRMSIIEDAPQGEK